MAGPAEKRSTRVSEKSDFFLDYLLDTALLTWVDLREEWLVASKAINQGGEPSKLHRR